MKLRKVTSAVLATAVAASMLVGCGGGTEVTSQVGPDLENAVPTEEYWPLKETLNVQMAGVREDEFVSFSECEMFKELEKKTNIHIDWIDWPQSTFKEKRNLAFNGGSLPDAMYGSWILDPPDVVKYGGEGMLLDFTPYLNETYMPNFCRILDAIPDLRNRLSTPDGHLYALPTLNQNALPQTDDTLLINTEWLAKVGKEMPTTIDELYDVLKAFKEAGDLNGNGQSDEVPMTFKYAEGNTGLFGLMGFTGVVSGDKHCRLGMKDGKPVFVPATDEYKEYMHFLNKLYSEGLLDQEAFTMDNPSYNAKTQTSEPKAGVISAWSAEQVNGPIPGNDESALGVYQYVAPLQGPNPDVKPIWTTRQNFLNRNLSFVISSAVDPEKAEALVRWADLQYDKDTSVENILGKIGVHIQKEEGENNYSKLLNKEGKTFTNAEKSKYVPNKFAVGWLLDGEANFTDRKVGPQSKAAADELYKPYQEAEGVHQDVMTTVEEGEELAQLTTDLIPYVDQKAGDFITGKSDIDAEWDAYIAKLDTLGLQRFMELKTAIHERA